jgi:RNA polymerase sigma factor, sigma-70 family/RNA polymerase sigma-70 factor, sigma-B/F/G subfamily
MATAANTKEPSFHPPNRERLREDQELFTRYADKHDPVDRDLLVERFMPLARSLASRYLRRDEPFDDIFQVACLGLLKAIDGFDVSRGRAFSSYAVPTIVGEIKRHYRDRTWMVHVPRDLQDLTLAVDRTAQQLERELLRKPTVPEIATKLEVTDEDVLEALQASRAHRVGSLDAPVRDEEDPASTVGERIGMPEPGFRLAEHRAMLGRLMAVLSARDRMVLRLRYEEDLTQEQIGERIGISQMQVSRVLRQCIDKLRGVAEHAPERQRELTPS